MAMGCGNDERGLLLEGVESPGAPHRPWHTQPAYERQMREEQRIATVNGLKRLQSADGRRRQPSERESFRSCGPRLSTAPVLTMPKRVRSNEAKNSTISRRLARAEHALEKEKRRHDRVDRKLRRLQDEASTRKNIDCRPGSGDIGMSP